MLFMKTNIKKWYMKKYPTDEVGATLNESITFEDLFYALDNRKEIYEVLGGEADSIVRERVFEKLASLMGVNYDYIYEQWLM